MLRFSPLADLRFLQGFLASLNAEAEGSSLEPYEDHLYRFAGARSVVLGKVADEIEAQLGPWRRRANEPATSHLDQGHLPRPHPSAGGVQDRPFPVAGIVSGPFGIFRGDTNGPDRGLTQPRFSLVLLACASGSGVLPASTSMVQCSPYPLA